MVDPVSIADRRPRAPRDGGIQQSDDNSARLHPTVVEAKARFKYCARWEHNARNNFIDDIKIANADAYNGWQWPNDIKRNRDTEEKPVLTINKIRQHNLQITNDARQNKPGIKIRPTGNGATAESAQAIQAWVRHVEYKSNATSAYDTATIFQVQGGIGYIRVATDYVSEDSFDQDAKIVRVDDPLTVYKDPEAKDADTLDANFAFVFDDVLADEFDTAYPEYAGMEPSGQNTVDDQEGWVRTDYVRVCEYWRRVKDEDTLYAWIDPKTKRQLVLRESVLKAAPDLLDLIKNDPSTRSRPTTTTKVECNLIIGTKLVDTKEWPGKYIPIIPVIGEQTMVDGLMDRKGHTRGLIDTQRMMNYWASAAVEYGALQSKTPWKASAESIEGYETYWATANKVNYAVLPYNGLNDAGEPIAPPERIEPPVALPLAITGMQICQNEFGLVSGQYADTMGDRSNERSAKAINERQRQGDTSTYHFIDNLAVAIRATGKVLLDIFPHIYDTQRVLRCMAEDGVDFTLELDPKAQQVFQKRLAHDGTVAAHVLNPTLGEYEVEADTGPNWGTKREEAFNALSLILTQAPQLTSVIGDLLLGSSDFDKAAEAASRLRRMVPPQALGEGPSMQELQLQNQVQQLQGMLQKSLQKIAEDAVRIKGHAEKRDVDVFNAFTSQLKVLLDYKAKTAQPVNPKEIEGLIAKVTNDSLGTELGGIVASNAQELTDEGPGGSSPTGGAPQLPAAPPPVPGARQGRDGAWYVRDYARSGQYARVT